MKDYNFLLIEKYIKDDLSLEEQIVFDNLMKNGKTFAADVNLYKEIESTLTSRVLNKDKENDLRNTLESLGKKYIKDPKIEGEKEVFSLQRYGKYLAASLVIFGTLFFFNSKPNYTDFTNHQNIDLVVRGDSNKHLIDAQEAFNAKNYAIAEKELRAILYLDSTKIELQLYLGICLLEQNEFKRANSILEKIKNSKSIYKNKAIWYLALSKLKQKDYKTCETYLKLIPKDAKDYKNVKKLLKKL